jgi:hypothetical protein
MGGMGEIRWDVMGWDGIRWEAREGWDLLLR